ncbi:beta-propeller domain-containing protein [Virgibacillus necropolis]|uniref:beta-propeller domain-containing protein n=1 Tax=Virgibacillus necropolis TaxID=163877 RepID=UPI003850B898
MKKTFWFISGIGLAVAICVYMLLSNKVTAEIPSASSYVAASTNLSVHFSEEMDPDSFTKKTVHLEDSNQNAIPVSLQWNDKHTILTVNAPDNGYTINKDYQLSIANTVTSAAGDELASAFTYDFHAVGELPSITDKKQLTTLLKERTNNRLRFSSQSKNKSMELATTDKKASTTNVQEKGINEGDIVKTNGEHIFFARNNDVVIASADQKNSTVKSVIHVKDFRPTELYIQDDLLVTIGNSFRQLKTPTATEQDPVQAAEIHLMPESQTTVYIYDISNIEKPKKLREVALNGSLSASRKTKEHIYLIANSYPPVHLFSEKRKTKEDLRPTVKDTAVSSEYQPIEYKDMYFFPDSYKSSFLITASIDLGKMNEAAKVEAYLGASNHLYMSEKNMYLAVNKMKENNQPKNNSSKKTLPMPIGEMSTEIFQFRIKNGSITYHASTEVKGTLLNQFSMDEYEDTFRVATTSRSPRQKEPTTNNLYTFNLSLQPLGSLENLAEGERIYSVRFMDTIAYMVTFKQVDPLFVIDLKNPKKPAVLGKLKVPGFSNYLHPLNDDYVIGFGQETELVESKLTDEPRVRQKGLKISLFDVSDLAHPVEVDSEIIGDTGSYSAVNRNHHALYQHPTKNLFGFPANLYESKTVQKGDAVYQEQSFVYEGAFLYHISPEKGIELKDTITHQEGSPTHPNWESETKRMVSVGDYLYTLSFNYMKVYDINAEEVIKTINLPSLEK